MRSFVSKISSPAALLYLFLVAAQVVKGFYLASETGAPPGFTLLYPLGLLWTVGSWLREDSRRRGVVWVFDMGLFLYIAWLVFMPYYLLKTRGAKGLLTLLAFLGVYLGAYLAGVLLCVLLTP